MFIYLSKLFQALFRTSNFLLLFLLLGVVLLRTRWEKWGKRLVTVVSVLFFLIAVLPVGSWIVSPLERAFPTPATLPEKIDGIITMGGVNPYVSHYTGKPALTDEAEVLTTGVWLARKYPSSRLVFSGGSGSIMYGNISEASAAYLFFDQQGIESRRLLFDTKSRGTQEKAEHCLELIHPKPDETWILITSAMRMPRTYLAFKHLGWKVIPYSVDFRSYESRFLQFNLDGSLKTLWYGIKEWVGLLAYRLTGRTDSLLPSGL